MYRGGAQPWDDYKRTGVNIQNRESFFREIFDSSKGLLRMKKKAHARSVRPTSRRGGAEKPDKAPES